MTENDLEFVMLREYSPQWEVRVRGAPLAVVTERVVASPPYAVNAGGREQTFATRDEVVGYLLTLPVPEVTT